jgi:adenylate cyclase
MSQSESGFSLGFAQGWPAVNCFINEPIPPGLKTGLLEGDRRLAAIMFTDIAGYTALTQENESATVQLLERHRSLLRPIFAGHGGREIKTIGDAFLVEFGSALDAVLCAIAIQSALNDRKLARGEALTIRIGIHVGDVIVKEGDVIGDAVNIASRIETLAEPGGVCVSEQVCAQVKNKIPYDLTTIGRKQLKNVSEPIEVYRIAMPWEKKGTPESRELDKRRIAVLPFTNLSSDPEEGYFADGMTEELITSLSGVRQLTVIARTSVMGYKGTTKKVKEIGKELEVGSMLEGSVRKAGNRVRITAQLIDAESEGHLWAQNYDRQLVDVFAIQSEIAEKVAEELRIRLVDSERRVIEKRATGNTEAYTHFLRGRTLVGEETEASLRQAVGLFERALNLDPEFARAHAGLADCYMWLANDGYEPYEQAVPKAELSAKKALELDPELSEAHGTLARIFFLEDHLVSCENEAKRAVELNPSLPEAYWVLANIALIKGSGDEGIRQFEAAYRLDPSRPTYIDRLGSLYFYMGKESEALYFWEKTVAFAPAATYRNMCEYHVFKENYDKATELFSTAEKLEPTNYWVTWMRGFIAGRKGDRDAALQAIHKIEDKWVSALALNSVGFIHYALGDLDSYFTYINRAADQHLMDYRPVMFSPLLARGREDPRYKVLIDKVRGELQS